MRAGSEPQWIFGAGFNPRRMVSESIDIKLPACKAIRYLAFATLNRFGGLSLNLRR
jgi:hypothetical protein